MKSLPVVLLAGCACLCHAGVPDDRAFLSQLQENAARLRHQDLSSVVGALPAGQLSGADRDFIARLQQQQQTRLAQGAAKPQPAIQYFVSFSIPREGLAIMLADADRLHIPVSIRGMINNNFRQTVSAVFDMARNGNRGGVQINPVGFRQFGITAVPALVVTCEGHTDRIAGDIRLDALLEKVAKEGDCAPVARHALETARREATR
ncbi:type-F conjugative transfer system pilin assembly protein TrbC [Cedecea sp. NFIX57]|uniref:type-F conjugative transfer system pilin assembly protein TrbC n=1 Tax=Cedecea sp. NFIX57 TaxID=1566286 RepID=UPI000A0CF005|nr:type-F conjugative transfer system pilin assembly protein TrbC [Cedecea sp. NFIX57]SMG60303.1 conjugal transfer pilus assembly protein TrbC [Cedecea sp. NFIX57]